MKKTSTALRHVYSLLLSLSFTLHSSVLLSNPPSINDQYLQREASAQRAKLNEPAKPLAQLAPTDELKTSFMLDFPEESPCFKVERIMLENIESFSNRRYYLALVSQAKGRCLGGLGIKLLMSEVQNKLIKEGFVTTRVVAPSQDLLSGELRLLIVKGMLRDIRYKEGGDSWASLLTAMPASRGRILNIRDVEQGLDNLHQIPWVSASMQIVPGERVGESDLEIKREQNKYFRIDASLSDSGTKETGKHQGGLTFSLDNLFSLSETMSLTLGKDMENESDYNTRNYSFSYVMPLRYFNFSYSRSGNQYVQTVAGINSYKYSGESDTSSYGLGYVLSRGQDQKTAINFGLVQKSSKNYVNDVELEVQARKTSHVSVGITHQNKIGHSAINLGINYKKGVRWFGAKKAPEEYRDYGSALYDMINVNATLLWPFSLGGYEFTHQLAFQCQLSLGELLTPPDRFSIGGRSTVRGFDGELSLSADDGYYLRNDLSMAIFNHHKLYLGFDYGHVSGENAENLPGDKLLGAAFGVKGKLYKLSYDFFTGAPIYKPEGFKAAKVVFGFNLNWNE